MNKDTNLIWIDLEMTGLIPEKDVIIEIATVVTDKDLNVLAEGPSLAIHQSSGSWLGWMSGIPNTILALAWSNAFKRATFQQNKQKFKQLNF